MPAVHRLLVGSIFLVLTAANLSADTTAPAASAPPTNAPASPAPPPAPSLFNFTVNSLDGKPVDLSQYKNHVVLVVNTASKGGYTPQYNGLEKLYEEYKDKGLVVLGFPSNDFGAEEPGTDGEIAAFCANSFHVTFPMFDKVKTRGDGCSPVYQFLATGHGTPQWNFHKYLVDKSGKVINEFPSQVTPDDRKIRDAIEAAIKE